MLAAPPAPAIHYTEKQSNYTLLHSWAHSRLESGTTDHFGVPNPYRVDGDAGFTPWVMHWMPISPSHAVEVERLRDLISDHIGLTRQEIARAIGVDRRSLSGFVSGEIRPTETRMAALRALAVTATWSFAQFGELARDVFRSSDDGSMLLAQIADGRIDIRSEVRESAARIGLAREFVVTTRTRRTRRPLYLDAAAIWSEESRLPERRGTPRDASVYEQDLSQAPDGVAPPKRPRRRNI